MKLAVILIALSALSWHHGAMGQRECQCDCTCPSTTGMPECDAETTSELPLTKTPEPTTTTPEPTTTTTPAPTTTTTPEPTTTTTPAPTKTPEPTTTPTPSLDCGVHTIEEGITVTLQSPNYPEKYGKKDKCEWELTCSNANGVISVSCEEFKTDPKEDGEKCKDTDYVRIKDGSGDKLGDFCGTKGPELTTSDNYMKFKFSTDGDSTKKSGFSCQVLCSVPTTTPVALTTTDLESVYSGMCSISWIAEVGSITWESPFYDGTTNYPDSDYCCWLNITIPTSFSMFLVTLTMNGDSKLHETSQCTGDKITYNSPSSDTSTPVCGDLSGQSWTATAIFHTQPVSFGFQWCSDSIDGGTDVGFSMEILGQDLNPGRK